MGSFLYFHRRKLISADNTFPHGNANYQFRIERVTSTENKLETYADLEKCNESGMSFVFLSADM